MATAKGGGGKVVMRAKGKKPVTFNKGGLHRSTGTPMGQKIPASKVAAAKRGAYGKKAVKQANMDTGMLAKGRATAAKKK